ncbi:hypothetical protein D3C77_779540 [compost metagenome]
MSLEILLPEEAHVIGRHQRRATAFGKRHRGMEILFIVDATGALHFQVEALGEHRTPFLQQRLGQPFVSIEQGLADLPFLGS